MSILINKDTKVITQGMTGKTGQFHTRMCREYANGKNAFVAGVHPKKAGEEFEGVPIYASVKEAKEATGATVSVIYVPPAGAAAAIWEAAEADLDLVICITEGIPVRDMLEVRNRMRAENKKTLLHGEAIAIGMILESYISLHKNLITPAEYNQIKTTIKSIYDEVFFEESDIDPILELLIHDKKNEYGNIQFALIDGIGKIIINQSVENELILKAFQDYKS